MEDKYILVEAYLNGELTGDQLMAFETALQQDENLASAVKEQSALHRRLQGMQLRQKVQSALQSHVSESQKTGGNRRHWYFAATAIVLLVIAVWVIFRPHSSPTPMEQPIMSPTLNPDTPIKTMDTQLPPAVDRPMAMHRTSDPTLWRAFYIPPTSSQFRNIGTRPSEKTVIQLALEALEQKKYATTLQLLQTDESEAGHFIRGHAHFQLEQFAAAAVDFKAVESSFQFRHEARWLSLLCRVARQKNKKDPVINSLLQAMIADTDYPFREKAVALKAKMQ